MRRILVFLKYNSCQKSTFLKSNLLQGGNLMELQNFTEKVIKALYQYYDAKVKIETHKVYKNNGILLQGICALYEGRNIAPTVYLNDFFKRYQEGESLGKLVKEIIHVIEQNQVSKNLDVDFFMDYEKVKKRLVFRLIHKEKNKELLKKIPYQIWGDLAVVCHCLLMTKEIGTGTILIYKEHLQAWKISEEQLFEDAKINSPRIEPQCILSMGDMVKNILEDTVTEQIDEICEEYPQDKEKLIERTMDHMIQEIEENHIPMYVLTNAGRYYGAATIVYPGVMQKISEMLQDDFYILPSSVHELIFIAKSEVEDVAFLNEMIQEVNQSHVAEEEWLSDHAYLYVHEEDNLVSIVS